MAQTIRAFLDAHDGNAAVAKATGYSEGAVALWVHRNRLPRTAWPEIMKALPDVSLDDLLAIEAAASAANDSTPSQEAA